MAWGIDRFRSLACARCSRRSPSQVWLSRLVRHHDGAAGHSYVGRSGTHRRDRGLRGGGLTGPDAAVGGNTSIMSAHLAELLRRHAADLCPGHPADSSAPLLPVPRGRGRRRRGSQFLAIRHVPRATQHRRRPDRRVRDAASVSAHDSEGRSRRGPPLGRVRRHRALTTCRGSITETGAHPQRGFTRSAARWHARVASPRS